MAFLAAAQFPTRAQTPSLIEIDELKVPKFLLTMITIDLEDVPLEVALAVIAEKGNFSLNYNRSRLPVDKKLSVRMEDVPALETLNYVMEKTETELVVTNDGQVTIVRVASEPLSPDESRPATLSGFVSSAIDGERLPYATIAIAKEGLATQSNSEGYYALRGILPGEREVTVYYVAHKVFRDTILFAAAQDLRRDIELTGQMTKMNEVIVEEEASKDELRQLPSVVSVPMQSVKSMPAMGEPDLMRSLQLLPGVQAASELSSGLYVRGGGPDQTGIYLDQVRLYNPSHAFGFFSTFNPDAIKNVTFYKGAYPARYGGTLGAVLDVQNRDGNRREFSTSGGVSLISSRLVTEGPLGDGSWMIAGRRTYLDPVLNAIKGSSAEMDGLGYHFFDLNGKVNAQLTPDDNLMISAYGGDDNLDLAFHDEADSLSFNMIWGNRALTGRWTHVFSPEFFGRLIAVYSKYRSDLSIDIFGTPGAIRNRLREITLKGDVDYFPSPDHTVRGGADFTLFRFDYGTRYASYRDNLQSDPYLLSAFLQDEWQVSVLTEARFGLRTNYYEEGKRFVVNPRFSLTRTLQEGLRAKLGGGSYQQFLQLISSEGFSGGDIWVPLDDTVEPGRSWQVVSGLEWEPSGVYRLSAEAYYTDLANLVLLDEEREENVDQGNSQDVFKTDGTGYATGMELFAEKRGGKLTGWIGYTLGWTRRTFAEVDEGRSFAPKYDRRHDVSMTGVYRFKPVCETCGRWSLNFNFVYGTGQAFTPAAARYTLRDPALDQPVDRLLGARRNSGRLLPYHRLDTGIRRTLKLFGPSVDGEVYLQLFNTYNRRNEWFVEFDAEDSSKKPRVVRMLTFLPTFGFDFKF
ncbi:MAG: TonB-dependent receptor plug domain-containing protein [Candidatus Latescibacterota bacterium]|nr:TonB-dependent receptor plug domain-containing protein [Candidatus Latescibacterota bacterium]